MVFLLLAAGLVGGYAATSQQGPDDVVARFYLLRSGTMAWSGTPQAMANARLARMVLAKAADEGLDPERYGQNLPGDDRALSAALLSYMRDLAVGREDLRALDADMGLPARTFDAATVLADAMRENRLAVALQSLAPRHQAYVQLRDALAETSDVHRREQIAANMERWRWLPPALEPDRIVVNAAAAELGLWLDDRRMLSSRVVVGKPKTPTPILRAESAALTLNPPWTVPRSIANNEILPKLKRNSQYLRQQNMVLLDGPAGDPHGLTVDWRAIPAGRFPYRVQQQPGPDNALGRIKLELPNRFDVYLHDTPAKTAFAAKNRALSHGCVRVEQIMPLATYALAQPRAAARIEALLHTTETRRLSLRRTLPVYFLYWTASVDAQGDLQFAPDIYGRDFRLIAAMKRAPLRVAANIASCARG
jgi:murein L,D-transpeptidase YcbB/YkuD